MAKFKIFTCLFYIRELIALGAHRSKNQSGIIFGEYYEKYLQYRYTARTSFLP